MPVTQLDNTCLYDLGMTRVDVEAVSRAIRRGRGLIFVCGPPGSGRRTAMYSLLRSVNCVSHSLAALERSVHRPLAGVSQTEIPPGKRISDLLHAVMATDADVLLVDPIQSVADAISLIRAASRMVVIAGAVADSTLAPLCQLLEMGAPARLICGAVTCAISTRLVPRLCPTCRRPIEVPLELLTAFPPLQEAAIHFDAYESPGCSACNRTGRQGSIAVYDVREVGPQLESILGGGYSVEALARAGLHATIMGLLADALRKSAAGLLDLRDLEALVRQCPARASFVKFWEN